jgi:exosortase/archaeosortase
MGADAWNDPDRGGGPANLLEVGVVLTHLYESAGVYTATVTASNSVSMEMATSEVMVSEYLIYLPFATKD